jgi:hypothetical protein
MVFQRVRGPEMAIDHDLHSRSIPRWVGVAKEKTLRREW